MRSAAAAPRAGPAALAAAALAAASALLAACSPDPPDGADAPDRAASAPASAPRADWTPPQHPGAPDRFGFGGAAAAARIALWDIDAGPDGAGLPPGSGSVADGRIVYETSCLQCHGPTGTEGPNDRLVAAAPWEQWPSGRAFGTYWPYATTLFDYTRRAMPQTAPGSLSDDEVYAVTAYVLHLNGLLPEDAVLDAAALAGIEMPARDRFVPDDRTGGPAVR